MSNSLRDPGSENSHEDQKAENNTASKLWAAIKLSFEKILSKYGEWHHLRTNNRDENHYAWLGWQVLIWCCGGALLWACFAPIDKGVSLPGVVITDSNRKTIQPAFSGIVEEIFVREGQQVTAGEVLIKMNPTNAQAQSNATKEIMAGFEAQAKGLDEAIVQKKKQSALYEVQLSSQRELVKEGYLARNKLLEQERQQLQLKASILEDEGNLFRLKKQISEQGERLNPYNFDLENTEIKSPVDGSVVNLTIFTKGGVMGPGQKLMDVIPTSDSLLIEGQLPVHLIDKVHVDLPVEMMFTAFNTNRTPHIPGVVTSVGADRIVDEKTGVPYYKVHAKTTPAGVKLLSDLKVRPGMPVEIFVKTGEQSTMTYLLKPIFDRSHSALRED